MERFNKMDFSKLTILDLNVALQGLDKHRFLNNGQIEVRTHFHNFGNQKISELI